MNKIYTGIGSRDCPIETCLLMTEISRELDKSGFVLRSGGADGADLAFEAGVISNNKEIYLPWKNFNSNPSKFIKPTDAARELASTIHPVWDNLSYGAKSLHARNAHQVLGLDLKSPSDFVICWTKGGGIKGGTATAMKIASSFHIPVYNLFDSENRKDAASWINFILTDLDKLSNSYYNEMRRL